MMGAARTRIRGTLGLGLAAILLSTGCAMVGPKYKPPETTVKHEWADLDDPQLSSEPLVDPEWWSSAFNDPVLDRLVEEALAQNLSLRSAGLRVLQAQQALSIATGKRYPQQQALGGSVDVNRLSNNAMDHVPLLEDDFTTYSLGFNLAWEVDFWGKYRRMVQQAAADLDASVADYDDAMVSLIAEVAQSYVMVRTFQKRLEIAHANVELQSNAVEVARARFEAGDTSEMALDVFQLMLYNTKASDAGIEQSLEQTKNSLAILLGKLPGEIDELIVEPGPIPSVPPEIAVGMPQNLIRRRPDMRAAERQLAAQAAQVGIAVTDLYPQFTIGGSIGSSTNSTDGKAIIDLFDSDSLTLGLFGSFNWNIFNYGRIKSNIRLQDAVFQQQLVDYRNMVLQVQGEVENAIVAYLQSHQQAESYRLSADYAQRATDIAIVQYEDGSTGYTPLWLNMWFLYMQQNTVASVEGSVATNLVQVYKSLGGGWEVRAGQDPVELLPEETKDEMRERLPKRWNKVLQE
jgi:NodT family efflux transporter outer membrane factor (OMF) lipoprotein